MLGFFLLLLFAQLIVLTALMYCCQVRKMFPLLALSVLPALCWVFFNPVYTQGPILELSYRHTDSDEGTNWANGFTFQPKQVIVPKTISALQKAVKENKKVRVIGGGHSWSPLIETNDTLIQLSHFDTVKVYQDHVTTGAGASLQRLSDLLSLEHKMFRGFGSVKKQTVGGAFSTSLHGNMPDAFSKHVRDLKAVLANGSIIHTDDMLLWRDSMGLLGVIYEFNISIYNMEYVDVTRGAQKYSDLIKLLEQRATFDAIVLSSTSKKYNEIEFRTRVVTPHKNSSEHQRIVPQKRLIYYLYDTLLLPFLVLFGGVLAPVNVMPLVVRDKDYMNVPIIDAFAHPAEFGFSSGEYAIPLVNCTSAFKDMYEISPGTVSYEIRFVEGSSHCLSWSKTDSCAIDVSPLNLNHWSDLQHDSFYKKVEQIAFRYGGSVHLGKHIAGLLEKQIRSFPCFDLFNETRTMLDPSDKFVNKFAEEYIYYKDYSNERYTDKTARHIIFSVLTYIVILVLLCAPFWKDRKYNNYVRLSA